MWGFLEVACPDGIVSCSCHGRMLVEVKCPYRCNCQHLQEVAVHAKDFGLQETDETTLALDPKLVLPSAVSVECV